MDFIDLFDEEDIIKKLNEMDLKTIAHIYSNFDYANIKFHGENLVEFITGGWSDNEFFISCLTDYRCKYHYHYVGYIVGGSSFFMINKTLSSNYRYSIIELKK